MIDLKECDPAGLGQRDRPFAGSVGEKTGGFITKVPVNDLNGLILGFAQGYKQKRGF